MKTDHGKNYTDRVRTFFNEDGRPNKPKPAGIGYRYGKLLEQHEKNQSKLRRAFKAWEKTNAQLRRAEKQLDKLQAAHLEEGGE